MTDWKEEDKREIERRREGERRREVEETRVGSPNEYLISAYLTPTKV